MGSWAICSTSYRPSSSKREREPGAEVADVAADVLERMSLGLEILKPPCGEKAQADLGTFFPDETKKLG